jgi:hypothetical protein
LWQLIVRLNANSQKHIYLLQDIYHKDNLRLTVEQWIDQSVITQCLFQQLTSVESDVDLLEYYYDSKNFIEKKRKDFFVYYSLLNDTGIFMIKHIED